MDIFIYSDESGVFDKKHNDYFVFGGLVFIDKKTKDIANRKYHTVEKAIRKHHNYDIKTELKACVITNSQKGKIYRSLNQYYKFGVIIKQKRVLEKIFDSKQDKQRYLDYAYKIAVKRCFENLINRGIINKHSVSNLHFFVDQHTTATNGRYELKESLEKEFKRGTYNKDYSISFPPLFKNLVGVHLKFCDSAKTTLIRAADIIANNIYHKAVSNDISIYSSENPHIITLP